MSWNPRYMDAAEEKIVDNCLLIIERDMKDALDTFYPSANYPDFQEKTLGEFIGLNMPALSVDPETNSQDVSEDDSRVKNLLRATIWIGVTDTSSEGATRKVLRYRRTLSAVLRSASKADWTQGITSEFFGFFVNIKHDYGPMGRNKSQNLYFRPARLDLTVGYQER